jgi:hypothetical protein
LNEFALFALAFGSVAAAALVEGLTVLVVGVVEVAVDVVLVVVAVVVLALLAVLVEAGAEVSLVGS